MLRVLFLVLAICNSCAANDQDFSLTDAAVNAAVAKGDLPGAVILVVHKDKVVFHLADLFHSVVLDMQNAAEGKCTYEDVWRVLGERAREKGLEEWLDRTLSDLDQ